MTDHEFVIEIKRGLGIIMRAMVRRYALSWLDFLPREFVTPTPAPVWGTVDRTLEQP